MNSRLSAAATADTFRVDGRSKGNYVDRDVAAFDSEIVLVFTSRDPMWKQSHRFTSIFLSDLRINQLESGVTRCESDDRQKPVLLFNDTFR